MKLLFVCPRLCHGGAERVAVSLANGFVRRGHEVVFFADLYEEQTYVLDDAVQVRNLVPQTSNKLKKWGGAIKILRMQMKNDKPDVLIGIMSLCSIVAKLASIGFGIPVIATEHNAFEKPEGVKFSFFERFYKYHITKLFDIVTVLTGADKLLLGRKRQNAVVMPNPLVFISVDKNPKKENIILAAGRVDNWHVKGFDVLIRALARVLINSKTVDGIQNRETDSHNLKLEARNMKPDASPFEDWRLVIAGVWRNSETRTYLDGIAKECGVLDKIEYIGFVEDMQKMYAESSIFVLSSRYEGFGLVLIEAMSQGCACIACDYKGRQREILNPAQDQSLETRNLNLETRNRKFEACDTGILCEPDNVEALAEAMAKMITDDEYRESIRKNAIERSKYYSIENTMDRWETLLKQIV